EGVTYPSRVSVVAGNKSGIIEGNRECSLFRAAAGTGRIEGRDFARGRTQEAMLDVATVLIGTGDLARLVDPFAGCALAPGRSRARRFESGHGSVRRAQQAVSGAVVVNDQTGYRVLAVDGCSARQTKLASPGKCRDLSAGFAQEPFTREQ